MPSRCRVKIRKLRITLSDTSLFGFSDRKICGKKGHRHSVVVADFVKTDGFETVGLLETETVGAGGKELYSEAFTGKSDGGIEIRTVRKVDF